MKLTKYMREAFVRAAMQDVPQVDHSEAIRAAVIEATLAECPPLIQRAWTDSATRPYVKTNTWHCSFGCASLSVSAPTNSQYGNIQIVSQDARAKIAAMVEVARIDYDRIEKLRRNLVAVAESCSTRAQLAKALPEFERYLPADDEKAIRSVPAIANVVTDFVAAGWPKGKAAAA